MKIDLLNEDDINNINIRKQALELIDEQVIEFTTRVENEVFTKVEQDGFILEELNHSEKKLQNLLYQYKKHKNAIDYLITCSASATLSVCIVISRIEQEKLLHEDIAFSCLLLAISIYGIVKSINGTIIRHKIKRNFKTVGLLLH